MKHNNNRKRPQGRGGRAPAPPRPELPSLVREPAVKVQYGKAFILLEDENKNTFEFVGGNWVPYARTISECRQDCNVTQLSQKLGKNTRYEVREPLN
jgi:hypothetical protein